MKVYLSKTAEEKLTILLEFLLTEWNQKVRNDFLSKLKSKIDQISNQPESCPQSEEVKGLFKCVVTKQNTFYYQINIEEQAIEIITFIDTRQNPKSIIKEIKSYET